MCDVPREHFVCEEVKAAMSLPEVGRVTDQECSSSFQEFLNEKEQQYKELWRNMKEEISLATVNINDNIEKYRVVAHEELSMLRDDEEKEGLEITNIDDLGRLTEQTQKHRLKVEKILYELSLDLESLEQSRCEDTKVLMSNFKQDALKLKHFSADVIEKDLDAEIVEINTQMFEHFQHIEDIKLQLQIQADDIINSCQRTLADRTNVITEQLADRLRKDAKKEREEDLLEAMMMLSQKNNESRDIFSQMTADLFEQLAKFPANLELPEWYDVTDDFWKHWMRSLNKKLEVLDKLCKSVKDLLNKTANAIVDKFEEQISNITLKLHLLVEDLDDDSVDEETGVTERFSVLRQNTSETREYLQIRWQDTIDKVKTHTDRAKNIILDFISIWTDHLTRFEKIRKSVNDSEEKSLAALTKNENAKIKVLRTKTKAAREAKDVKKLEALCKKLEETYFREVERWDESFLAQKEFVEHVKAVEIEKLVVEIESDIKQFLHVKYPKLERFSEALTSKPRCSLIPIEEKDSKMDLQVDSYLTYLRAVENRCLGMYEMMERFLPLCAGTLREEAEDWVLSHIMQELVPVYDTRIRELMDTAKREVDDVRTVRFAEIQIHTERSTYHSLAVKEALSSLDNRVREVKKHQQTVLEEFNQLIEDLDNRSEKPLGTRIFVLQNQWRFVAEKLEQDILEAKIHLEAKIEDLVKANNLFSATAKSFKSGGNYSPEELKALKKQLTSLSKSVANQKKILTNKYDEMLNNIKSPVLESKINVIEQELKGFSFKTEISNNLSILRMRLRTEIEIMKSKNQHLESRVHCLKKYRKIDDSLIKETIARIDSIVNYMKFPESMQNLECTEDPQDSIKNVEIGVSKKNPKNTKKTEKSQPLTLKPLFKYTIKPDDTLLQNNFFAKTKDLILKKYEIMVSIIESAHSSNQTEKNKSKINKKASIVGDAGKSELPQQIKNLKTILRTYNSECETAWLDECKRFLDLFKLLRDNCNAFANTTLDCVHDNYMNKLNASAEDFKPKLEQFYTVEESKRNKKHFPLVLAHPNHKDKLDKWKETVWHDCTTSITDFRNILQQYTQGLQNMHDTYVSKIKLLKDHFNLVLNLVFDDEICNSLQENLLGVSCFKPYKPLDGEMLEEYGMTPKSIWSDIDCTRDEGNNQNQESSSSDVSSSVISIPCVEIEVGKVPVDWKAIENIKESALTARKLFIDEATHFKQFEFETKEWLKSLEKEIRQCQNLYHIENVEESILKKYCNKQ